MSSAPDRTKVVDRIGRTRLVTVASVLAVGLAGAVAVGANVGILDSASNTTVGNVSAVGDLVTRSISGHATEEMQRHYSTVGETEQRAGIARVVSLAGFREALRSDASKGEVVGKVVGNSP